VATDILEPETAAITEFVTLQDGFTQTTCGLAITPYTVSDITTQVSLVHTETYTLPTLCSGKALDIQFADQSDNLNPTFGGIMSWNAATYTLTVAATTNAEAGTYNLRIKAEGFLVTEDYDFTLTINIDPALVPTPPPPPTPTPSQSTATFTSLSTEEPFFVSEIPDQYIIEYLGHTLVLPRAYDPDTYDKLQTYLSMADDSMSLPEFIQLQSSKKIEFLPF